MHVPILELTGPSGSGKSTVYRHLAASGDTGPLAPIVRFLPGLVLKSRVYWLLAPLVLLRFRTLFRAMLRDRGRGALGPTRHILGNLSWVLARQSIARVQARLTGKTVMVDEGFLQAGLGFSYQLGSSFTDHWNIYTNSIPRTVWYAVFQCSSRVAARRSVARPSGTPHNMRDYLARLDADPNRALARANKEYQRLLKKALRGARLTWLPIDGELPVTECADQLVRALEPR